MGQITWTEDRKDKLARLWYDLSLSMTDIGNKLGVSGKAVDSKGRTMGLPVRSSITQAQSEEALARLGGPVDVDSPIEEKRKAVTPVVMTRVRACAWPIGDPLKSDFHFCGVTPLVPGKPYCAEHTAVAYSRLNEEE